MVLPSLVGLAQHARIGNVDLLMGAGLALGTLVGSAAGSSLALNAPPMLLEGAFGVGMLYLGIKTLSRTAVAAWTTAAKGRS